VEQLFPFLIKSQDKYERRVIDLSVNGADIGQAGGGHLKPWRHTRSVGRWLLMAWHSKFQNISHKI